MKIGVAYYPEHWPEDRWPTDARMMVDAGIDVVRVGEFAWSRLEPRRGIYDMVWLERAVKTLADAGLEVILGTPTAAPPTWLFSRHPHMAPMDREGLRWYPGSRRDACLNNRAYRRYVRRIVREVARVFGPNKDISAWQIDNEIGCHGSGRCYCDDCEQAFRQWLKMRYGTIERLNRLWGTAFWSQDFTDWQFVPAPRRTPAGVHPSLALDYQRFMSATAREFIQDQRALIEQYCPTEPVVTTNSLGVWTDQLNQFSIAGALDVAAFDNYPIAGPNPDGAAVGLDVTRSVKRAPFWVLEQQSGPTTIRSRHSRPRPGELRLWSFQAAARGADLIAYFRWRTCGAGQEMHWHGMLDPDGRPSAYFEELRGAIAELKRHAPLWEGRLPRADVALVLDYDSHWALRADSMSADLDLRGQFCAFHALLRRMGVAVDVLAPDQDPAGYAVAVVPMPMIVRDQSARLWQGYVEGGGRLLVTAPAGYRTEQNAWAAARPPAALAGLLGVEVPGHDVFSGEEAPNIAIGGAEFPVRGFCCLLEVAGATAVGAYGEGPAAGSGAYAGVPAVTRAEAGQGSAWFLGAVSTDELYGHLLERVLEEAGVPRSPWSSDVVEVVPLRAGEGEAPRTFVLNHGARPAALPLGKGARCTDLLTGSAHTDAVRVAPYGVVLLEG